MARQNFSEYEMCKQHSSCHHGANTKTDLFPQCQQYIRNAIKKKKETNKHQRNRQKKRCTDNIWKMSFEYHK